MKILNILLNKSLILIFLLCIFVYSLAAQENDEIKDVETDEQEWFQTDVFINEDENAATVVMRNPIIKFIPKGEIYVEIPRILVHEGTTNSFIVKGINTYVKQPEVVGVVSARTLYETKVSTILEQKEPKNLSVFIVDLETDKKKYETQHQCYLDLLKTRKAKRGHYRIHWAFKSAYEPFFDMRWPVPTRSYHFYTESKETLDPTRVKDEFVSNVFEKEFSQEGVNTEIDFFFITTEESNLHNAREEIKQMGRDSTEKKIRVCYLTEDCNFYKNQDCNLDILEATKKVETLAQLTK
jgi:hypothetical protein